MRSVALVVALAVLFLVVIHVGQFILADLAEPRSTCVAPHRPELC